MDWPHWHEESRPMVRKGGTLHKILEIRQKAGCPIKALDLTRCENARSVERISQIAELGHGAGLI